MMTKERIEEIQKKLDELKAVLPYPWHLWKGRSDSVQKIPEQKFKRPDGTIQVTPARETKVPARYDLFSGDPVNDADSLQKIAPGRKQVCHFHPESPMIYDKSTGYQVSMPFLEKSPDLVEELLNEVKELQKRLEESNVK